MEKSSNVRAMRLLESPRRNFGKILNSAFLSAKAGEAGKTRALKKPLLSLFVFFAAFLLFAQDVSNAAISRDSFLADYVTRAWSATDGLPGNTVTDIMQSSSGYIYLGTYGGLVRFDGVEFVTYNRRLDPKYMFTSARAVFEDSRGNIWSGSNDEGVHCIGRNGEVTSFTVDNGLPNNSVRAVCEDGAGRIWVGTSAGVAYISNGVAYRPQGLEAFGAENILITSLYCDTAGRVWLVSADENGTYVYVNGHFERFGGFQNFENPIITYVMQDRNANFWYGVAPHYAVRIVGSEETVYDVGRGAQPGIKVSCIYQDRRNNMWFSRDTGVTILHDGIFSYFDESSGLRPADVQKIMEDREGNIWFATDRGGIVRLSPSKFRTTTMPTPINAIAEDRNRGLVWLAGDNGLYCLQGNTFIENSLTETCRNIRIRDVAAYDDGTVLVSCYAVLGEVIMDSDGTITSVTQADGLSGDRVRVGIRAGNGDIYIGTTSGLNILNRASGEIQQVTRRDGIENDYIMCIYEDSDGEIWAGTDGGGVFTMRDGRIDRQFSTANGLAGNVVFKIFENTPGDYWFTTGNGVSRLKRSSFDTFTNYDSSVGLGSDDVFQVVVDYTNTAWMLSNRGIFSAPMADFDAVAEDRNARINSQFFGQSDGLISEGITSTAKSMRDSLGRIWFTLIDGFAVYDPLSVTANRTAPLVNIEQITVDNEVIDWNGETVTLGPDVQRINIKYTGLCFVSSEQTRFQSMLQGFESEFSAWTTNRYVSYTNLRPGTYRFIVRAENADGVESANSGEFEIIKRPYFWEIPWFWVIVTVVVVALAFLMIRQRFVGMRSRQAELEHAVQERTKELAEEQQKSEGLLLNILPREIADELKQHPDKTIARTYGNAAVLFADIAGFTKMAGSMDAADVVSLLNDLVSRFDERALREGVEKIKTIGDAYMAATGLSDDEGNEGVFKLMRFAEGMLDDLRDFNRRSKIKVRVRIGINNGKLMAGVIGKSKFLYDVWGDTVNVASRMESAGEIGKICVTETTYNILKDDFLFSGPFEVDVKGKGKMNSYLAE